MLRVGPGSRCDGCSPTRSSPSTSRATRPAVVDMPTMWAHNITNVGDDRAVTLFWTNDSSTRTDPDTVSGNPCDVAERLRMQGHDGRRDPTRDHPALPGHPATRRDRRPRPGAHRAELRLRAQRGLLRRPRASRARPLPRGRHVVARAGARRDPHRRAEQVLRAEQPDAVLVLGDTNSCISAVMAKRMRIPVFHMEAGNRCFDENVPEETNRRSSTTSPTSTSSYTEHARRNLLAEGLHPRRILLTGIADARGAAAARRPVRGQRSVGAPRPQPAGATSW